MHTVARIIKYSHFFIVRFPSPKIVPLLYKLSSKYTQFGMKPVPGTRSQKWGPLKTFAIYVQRGVEFRFNIGQYAEFYNELVNIAFIDPSSYEIEEIEDYEPERIELKVRAKWTLYPEQEEAKDFAIENVDRDNNNVMLMMPTGTGKTVTSMIAAAKLGKRIAIIVLANYVDKWISDLQDIFEIDKKEIGVIKGSDALMRSTNYPGSGLPIPKAFIISLTTLNMWYKTYEEDRNAGILDAYACSVDDFYKHLGIGTVVFDEVHQHPHAVYRAFCYLHAPKTISLSATLLTKDPTLRKVQSMMFPRYKRYDSIKMKQYIDAFACAYQIMDFARSRVQTTEYGRNTYSHAAFEKSILRHKTLCQQYINMVIRLIDESYLTKKEDGDKLAVFVATEKMAEAMVHAIQKVWPNLDTRTYLEKDNYRNVIDAEIRVTTILSAGTAVDIPNLITCIMTNSIDSPIANCQTLGRLREIKGRDTEFYYLYCTTIPKHVDYHLNKVELFRDRVKSHKQIFLATLYP